MKFGKRMLVLVTALSLTMGAWAQEKTEKTAKKKAVEAVEEKKTAVKKKTTAAAEEKKATTEKAVEKKAAPVEKKAEAAEKKVAASEKKAVAKKGAAYTGGVVNLNTATKTQLMELPGVGEANADHIIKGRPYKSADELISKKVVQQRYYDEFKQFVTVK